MVIEVHNLTKNFGKTKVLDNLNFSIDRGEVIGFLGPNGAGKTTTMRILTGFLAPSSGDVKITELDILNDILAIRKKIGYLPENNPLYTDLKVYEYLEFIASTKDIADVKSEIRRVIRVCGLKERINQTISELSKGYKQRVGLAQALLGDPEIIILDEPTSGLDPNQIIEIRNLILKIGETKTIILSTHILSEVQATCNKAIIINRGKIVASGTTEELISQAKGKAQVRVVIAGAKEEILPKLQGLQDVENVMWKSTQKNNEEVFFIESGKNVDSRKNIFDLCVHSGWTLLELERKTMSLEDVFLELTK